jgi:hypothetical protein
MQASKLKQTLIILLTDKSRNMRVGACLGVLFKSTSEKI